MNPFEPHEFTDEDDKSATEWQQISGRKLTKMCRAGVPEHFRGGVWNKVMSPTMEEGGTPSHKVIVDENGARAGCAGGGYITKEDNGITRI